MIISRSIGYGLLAVGYVANHTEQKVVLSQKISKQYDIPPAYLLKILEQLVRANILHSKRGPNGGFSLARPARKISILEIIEAVNGPMLNQLNLIEQSGKEKFSVKVEQVYDKAIAQSKSVFEKAKISTMLAK